MPPSDRLRRRPAAQLLHRHNDRRTPRINNNGPSWTSYLLGAMDKISPAPSSGSIGLRNGHHQRQQQGDGDGDGAGDGDDGGSASYASRVGLVSSVRRSNKQTPHEPDGVDEERGSSESHEHEYEMSSLLGNGNNGDGQHANKSSVMTNKKQQRLRSSSHSSSSMASTSASSSSTAVVVVDRKDDDGRSRALFLKTAFWLTIWYGTSLATLFLNKIILSRPNTSVHVLGMCQMTAAAVLGGWSAFGGTGIVVGAITSAFRRCVRIGDTSSGTNIVGASSQLSMMTMRGERGGGKGSGGGADEENAVGAQSSSSSSYSSSIVNNGNNSKTSDPVTPSIATDRLTFHFVRDMSVVGILRGITVVLGLVALEHVPVSFVETIKATAPAFTVLFARLLLQERTAPPVMLSLVPVVAGLILCSASELRFDTVGFVAAVMNNCADCVQNVLSKKMLAHMAPTTLQFYASVAALALQAPFLLRDVAGLAMGRWDDDWGGDTVPLRDATEDDGFVSSSTTDSSLSLSHREMSITRLLVIDAVFYHLQSVSAYCTMGCMNPVSQSVANTLKRALLVWASVLYFGNPVTNSGIAGIIMVVVGVFLYNHVRRIHQS